MATLTTGTNGKPAPSTVSKDTDVPKGTLPKGAVLGNKTTTSRAPVSAPKPISTGGRLPEALPINVGSGKLWKIAKTAFFAIFATSLLLNAALITHKVITMAPVIVPEGNAPAAKNEEPKVAAVNVFAPVQPVAAIAEEKSYAALKEQSDFDSEGFKLEVKDRSIKVKGRIRDEGRKLALISFSINGEVEKLGVFSKEDTLTGSWSPRSRSIGYDCVLQLIDYSTDRVICQRKARGLHFSNAPPPSNFQFAPIAAPAGLNPKASGN